MFTIGEKEFIQRQNYKSTIKVIEDGEFVCFNDKSINFKKNSKKNLNYKNNNYLKLQIYLNFFKI